MTSTTATPTTAATKTDNEKTDNKLTPEQIEAFGNEIDTIRQRLIGELGEEDADYIRGIVKKQRQFEVAGRALMYLPPAWPLAVASLSISKILDNMEIGHNVMHGQYDWMGDPGLNSRMYEWDNVCPSDQWKYSHNYIHHTFTNILGKDRDIGYGILRMDEDQKWHPYYLGNPVYATLLMLFFEWGVAMHDLEVENIVKGKRTIADNKALHSGLMRKVRRQALKDYVLFPALTGPLFPLTIAGNATANLVRNIWAFNIIFCGHFPAGRRHVHRGGVRGRVAWPLVLPPAARLGEHHRRQAVPHHDRQPVAPDRAPPVPGPAGPSLPADQCRDPGDLRALRSGLQHRAAAQAAVQRGQEDLPVGPAGRQDGCTRARDRAAADAGGLIERPLNALRD